MQIVGGILDPDTVLSGIVIRMLILFLLIRGVLAGARHREAREQRETLR